MPVEVVIPSMGLTMEEGAVVEWLKAPGDVVHKDDPLFLLETDKAVVEVGSPATGILNDILLQTHQTVPVGTVVAIIGLPDDDTDHESERDPVELPIGQPLTERFPNTTSDFSPGPKAPTTGILDSDPELPHRRSSPAARRIAQEHGVDISVVRGSGPRGRIIVRDVLEHSEHIDDDMQRPNVSGSQSIPRRGRQSIARKLEETWKTVPMVTLWTVVSMDAVIQLYDRLKVTWKESLQIDLKWDALIVRAVGMALREHPEVNSRWTPDDGVTRLDMVNIGVAVALDDGLITPVIHGADQKSLVVIAREIVQMVSAARTGHLRSIDLGEGTFTVSNLGGYGVVGFTPIINSPETAILGVGAITEHARASRESVTPSHELQLALTIDHRVIDGAPAAKFLQAIKRGLEEPYRLVM